MVLVHKEQLSVVSRELLSKVASIPSGGATVVFLQGELGAGKTTFMQALVGELGVNVLVQSPTFVLMKTYPISWHGYSRLVHIDAYRLEQPEEFKALKPQEFLHDPHALVCIEWPERLGNTVKPDIVISFKTLPEGHDVRDIEIRTVE